MIQPLISVIAPGISANIREDKIGAKGGIALSKPVSAGDIQALQMMQTPIVGEAGLGYIMRRGSEILALNFSPEEVQAITLSLVLLSRTGDKALQQAGFSVSDKLEAVFYR